MTYDSALCMTQSLATLLALGQRSLHRVPGPVVAAIATEVVAMDCGASEAAGLIKRRVLEHLGAMERRRPHVQTITPRFAAGTTVPEGDGFHGD